ncbi:MAG TPA: hypothetical protein PLS84_02865 [Salinivirgaceae bacterium]|nr:hypothetical protein [Salinivirgaceae bacterium]
MNLFKKLFLSLLVVFSINKISQSQTNDTIVCDSLFLVKVNELISKNEESRRSAREYYSLFQNTWNSGYYNKQAQADICAISHNLLEVRKVSYAAFKNYLDALILFTYRVEHRKNYLVFNRLLIEYCNNRETTQTKISAFIADVRDLIDMGFLFDNPQTRWITSNTNFQFTINEENNMTVVFPRTTLTCYAQDDSIKIFETAGTYDLNNRKFYGSGGKVTWERAGFPSDSVYATFKNYSFETSRSLLLVDTVLFYNYYYFDKPLHGSIRYQAAKVADIASVRFPKFESFQKRFIIKNLYNKVDYSGGYVQHGSQFIGAGTRKEPATLNFWKEMKVVENGDTVLRDIVVMRAASEEYTFTKEKVATNNAIISVYLDEDSIYHPGLNLQYFVNSREVNLLRNNDLSNMSRSPYFDSYHMVEIEAELLKWNMNDTRVHFSRMLGTEESEAIFESYNYFSSERFYRLQGISTTNPLFQIRDFAIKIDSEEFYAEDLAKYMMFAEHKIRQLLITMSFEGYIYYDKETQLVTIRQKLYDYIMAATRSKDYDVISIKSKASGKHDNAVLELKNLDLQVNGVSYFEFSKANRVETRPRDGQIILKKNREIQFDGELRVGLYTFFGEKFRFNYTDYNIELESVDSLLMEISVGIDLSGHHDIRTVRSKIENISGIIHIDNPGNKSGMYLISRFPIFESTKESYVYYDDPSIHTGVYNRDSIYFKIEPYTLDSINNPEAEKIKLEGTFYSGNIFPAIIEEITVQEDLSLGFIHDMSQEPMLTYGGKGVSTGLINVSNQGIKVRGKVDYLRTTTWSDDFTYFLDSMNTLSTRFLNQSTKSPSLPLMEGNEIKIHWEPYNDKLYGQTTSTPLDMFNAQSKLNGGFVVEPRTVTGNGSMDIERSILYSERFRYTEMTIDADTSSWSLASMDKKGMTIKTDNVSSHIDFETRTGKFRSNDLNNIIYFPVNQYMAYADELNWNIDSEKLSVSSSSIHSFVNSVHAIEAEASTTNPAGSLFISTHSQQDSLNFISPITDIDLKNNILFTHEVQFVNVADAMIIPTDGNITIDPDARHRTLSNAEVIASRDNKYHKFYDATINITSRKFYTGNGYYDYIDLDKNVQKINFLVISVNKDINSTYANGKIHTVQSFTLSPAFGFMGDVKLFAQNKYLMFDGSTKLLLLPDGLAKHWLKFSSEIVPENVIIPIDTVSESANNKKLYHSLITNMDSVVTYTTFYAETTKPNFHAYTTTPGYLKFDNKSKKYETSTLERLENRELKDNYVSLNTQTSDFNSSGVINIVRDLGQVKVRTRGNIIYTAHRKEILTDLFMAFDFYFNNPNLTHIADTINKIESLSPINTLIPDYVNGMTDLIGDEAFKTLIEEQKLFGVPKTIPEGFVHSIVFTDLNMMWDSVDKAFKSIGKIGIGSILDRTINKFVSGHVEFRYVKSGTEFFIYLEPAPNHWYFFKYTFNSMLTVSSDPVYNEIIEKIKLKDRKFKAEGTKYTYYLTYPRVKDEAIFYFKGGKKEDLNPKGKKPRR